MSLPLTGKAILRSASIKFETMPSFIFASMDYARRNIKTEADLDAFIRKVASNLNGMILDNDDLSKIAAEAEMPVPPELTGAATPRAIQNLSNPKRPVSQEQKPNQPLKFITNHLELRGLVQRILETDKSLNMWAENVIPILNILEDVIAETGKLTAEKVKEIVKYYSSSKSESEPIPTHEGVYLSNFPANTVDQEQINGVFQSK